MGRYNFSPEELQKRAAISSELKKKFMARRAAADADKKSKKGAVKDEKKTVAAAPKIDFAAQKAMARDRRNFLAGTTFFSAGMLITVLGSNRFSFPRILFEPPTSFIAGPEDDFLPNNPIFFKEFKTWIIRTADRIYALSGRCTHLGCTPRWLASDQKFKCPCHGSGFRMSGVNFEGPAPRALERFQISLIGNKIHVEKAKMFYFEKDEWDKPGSFLVV